MPTQFERISAHRLVLLAIGKAFRAEYTRTEEPLPGRLAALLKPACRQRVPAKVILLSAVRCRAVPADCRTSGYSMAPFRFFDKAEHGRCP